MKQPFRVIFEDNHLLVVEKFPNVPVQRDSSKDPDLLTLLKQYIKEKYQKPGNVFLGLVHRLDRPVGGIMVFARTSKAAARLSEQIREHSFKKTYHAIVQGKPSKEKATLTHFLKKDQHTNRVSTFRQPTNEAKESILRYSLVKTNRTHSLVRVELITGRSHQIRAQFSAIGCPLVGDVKYGKSSQPAKTPIALFASDLSFMHPTTKEKVTFHAPLPTYAPWNEFSENMIY